MDLKQRKLIQNSNITLPHFEPGAEPGIEPGKVPFSQKLTAGMQGLLGMAQMFSQYKDAKDPGISPQEMIKDGGTQHVGDESFLRVSVDSSAAQNVGRNATSNVVGQAMSGASTLGSFGTLLGGKTGGLIGTGVGMLAGTVLGINANKKAKREAEEAKRKAEIRASNINGYRFDKTYTTLLQKQQAHRIGDDDAQELYGAKYGHEPLVNPSTNETFKQYKVDTATGMSYDTANAFGKKNEFIWKMGTDYLHKIKRGPDDNAKLHLDTNKDVIFTNDILNPFTGKTFAKSALQAKKEGWLPELLNQQIATKQQLGFYNNKKGGQLRHAAKGWENASWITGGLLTSLPGVMAGINQIQASKDNISTPRSYVAPNTQKYQNDLDSLDINMFPIYQSNREATSISNSKIAQSGGLSAGQQMLGYMTNAMNERDSISKALANAQIQRNAYRAEAAKVGIDTELRRAAQQQNAQQWDYAQEAAAHNAKVQANQMGWYNLSNALGNAYKNMWDYHQFNKMYNIYALDVNSRKPQKDTHDIFHTGMEDVTPKGLATLNPALGQSISNPADVKLDITNLPIPKQIQQKMPTFNGNYKFGSVGDGVIAIQEKLGGLTVDGKYGRRTKAAVIRYLKQNGLNPDGIVGPLTWNSLFKTK